MYRLFFLLCMSLVSQAQVLPPPVGPVGGLPPFVPGNRPFPVPGVGPVPGAPGIRNPYYNNGAVVPGPAVPIVTYSSEGPYDGTYAFSFTTADGKQAQENGYLRDAFIDNNGEPQGTQVVQGSYSYIAPDGTPIQVSYVADENGFRPSGVHIPADGRGAVPVPPVGPVIGGNITGRIVDPARPYDPYNPYTRNNYYNNRYEQRNTGYDPYRPSWYKNGYNNNGYNTNGYNYNANQDVTKKD